MFLRIWCWHDSDPQVEASLTQNQQSWAGNHRLEECCWSLYLYVWCVHGILRVGKQDPSLYPGLYHIVVSSSESLVFHLYSIMKIWKRQSKCSKKKNKSQTCFNFPNFFFHNGVDILKSKSKAENIICSNMQTSGFFMYLVLLTRLGLPSSQIHWIPFSA